MALAASEKPTVKKFPARVCHSSRGSPRRRTARSAHPILEPPPEHHHCTAEHSTEMREVGDARLRARDAEEKLDDAVDRDEQPRRHWNRRNEQQYSLAGKNEREGEE